ncbi:MAG: hypothetical protein AAF467_22805 [Actinomycetota bacterium]
MRWLVAVAILVRVVAAVMLILGPWVDQPSELEGWDVARFQAIADLDGRPWVDEPVEYPPGSVFLIELLGRSSVVATHRVLVAASLLVDLGLAALLGALAGRRAAAAYLLLGLPLVPMGLLRFDLWAAALAAVAAIALRQRRPGSFAVIATVAALVKAWPVLLLAPAVALGRVRTVGVTLSVMAAAGLGWMAYAGFSIEPVRQVVTLRGATGWHVESIGGIATALTSDQPVEQQLDAFRIGSVPAVVRIAFPAVTLGVTAVLAALGWRARQRLGADDLIAIVMLGTVSALLVPSTLLSPQFLLWLTPWAAVLAGTPETRSSADALTPRHRLVLVGLTAAAIVLTGVTLAVFGPPRLAETLPAALLAGRTALLGAVIVAVGTILWRVGANALAVDVPSGRAEGALG